MVADDSLDEGRPWGGFLTVFIRRPGEGRDLTLSVYRIGEISAFAGMTTG